MWGTRLSQVPNSRAVISSDNTKIYCNSQSPLLEVLTSVGFDPTWTDQAVFAGNYTSK